MVTVAVALEPVTEAEVFAADDTAPDVSTKLIDRLVPV
jgi:hypothetical protein